ncbi:nucleotidyltransferase family protein [Variovorax sp. HJSM1_2]|uniref:nucleotidyltransferase family protein n=1 Tax=Variovorax sp. HJSM1_2 TaxID=3366263 RepID=UPI003BD1484C
MNPAVNQLPVVLVLASGRGERFAASGGQVHKLQALLAGQPVLQHSLAAVRASGLPWHLEDAGHPGMGDTIAAAARATAHAPGWLVLPADLPLVLPSTLRTLADMLMRQPGAAQVLLPVFKGQRGHPVAFPAAAGAALRELRGNHGAAPVVKAYGAIEIEVDDAGCISDIDTLDDLGRAEQLWAARRAGA